MNDLEDTVDIESKVEWSEEEVFDMTAKENECVLPSEAMTKAMCESKHKSTWRMIYAVLTFLTVLIILCGWAVAAGHLAAVSAKQVDHKMDVHEARQNGSLTSIDQRLENIETKQSEFKHEFEKLGDKIDAMRIEHERLPP
jgi:hypothetical protein